MRVLHSMKKRSKRLKKTCSATNNNNLFTREAGFPTVIHRPLLHLQGLLRTDISWAVLELFFQFHSIRFEVSLFCEPIFSR